MKTGDDEKFLHSQKGLHKEDKPLLRGDDIKRYSYQYKGEFVWYVPEKMRLHRQTARPGEPKRFEQPKVLVKDTSTDFAGTFDDHHFFVKDVLIIIPREDVPQTIDLKFLTGIINSRAMYFYYRTTFKTLHVQNEELSSLPLPRLDSDENKARHDQLVKLVGQMLDAKRYLATAVTDKNRNYYENRCADLDHQMDVLMYNLYGITSDEAKIIEKVLSNNSGTS